MRQAFTECRDGQCVVYMVNKINTVSKAKLIDAVDRLTGHVGQTKCVRTSRFVD